MNNPPIKKFNFKNDENEKYKKCINRAIKKLSLFDHIILKMNNISLKICVKNVIDNFLTCTQEPTVIGFGKIVHDIEFKITNYMTNEIFNKLCEIFKCTACDVLQLKLSVLHYGMGDFDIEEIFKITKASYDQILRFINALYDRCDKSFKFYREMTEEFHRVCEKYNVISADTDAEKKKKKENLENQFQHALILMINPELKKNGFLLE